MAIIAPHCLPDGWRGRTNPHELVCAWPQDCFVQWGAKGVVFSKSGNYVTAFFEAFPKEPKTFIRGEGKTVEEAERAAFAKLEKYMACPGHEFERRGYTNGAGFCKHCSMFSSGAFEPTTLCTVCSKPTTHSMGCDEQGQQFWYCEEHEHLRPKDKHKSTIDTWLAEEDEDANCR